MTTEMCLLAIVSIVDFSSSMLATFVVKLEDGQLVDLVQQ